jgi:hypothetical protein
MAAVQVLNCTHVLLQQIDDNSGADHQIMDLAEPLHMALLQLPAVTQAANIAGFADVVWAVLSLSQQLQREWVQTPSTQLFVAQRQVAWLQQLLALPAARQIAASTAVDMLRYAMQQQPAAIQVLCQLPAAQQLDAAALSVLLRSAFVGSHIILSSQAQLQYLCVLPGAQQLPPWQLRSLLQRAVVHRGSPAVECLASLQKPAAGMSKDALLDLLDAAIRCRTQQVSTVSTLHVCCSQRAYQLAC